MQTSLGVRPSGGRTRHDGASWRALVVVLSFLCPHAAHADHAAVSVGVGTARPINTESAIPLARGRWSLGVRTEYVDFRRFSHDRLLALRRREPEADLHSVDGIVVPSLGVFYGITEHLTVGLRLPWVRRWGIREPGGHGGRAGDGAAVHAAHATDPVPGNAPAGVAHLGSADGIGDLSLLGQYRVWDGTALDLAVLVGLETPTGRTSERDRRDERFETEFQPGSGSWDPLLGLALTYGVGRMAIDASAVYTVVTEGAQNTDRGDVFTYGLALSYRLWGHEDDGHHAAHGHEAPGLLHGLAWDGVIELGGEWRDQESVDGIEDGNSGGNVLYLSPGLRLGAGRLSLALSVGVPIAVDLNGDQVDPSYRLVSTLGWMF